MKDELNIPPNPSRVLIITAFVSICLIWGSTYLAIRFAVERLPPFLMVGVRFLIAGSFLYIWARRRGVPRPTLLHWKSAAVVGGIMLFVGNSLVSWGEQRIPSGLAALLAATTPFWIVVLDWVRPQGGQPRTGVIIGLIIGFVGVALLLEPWSQLDGKRLDLLGSAMVLAAAFSWALGSIFSLQVKLPASLMLSAGMEMLAGGAMALVVGVVSGELFGMEFLNITLRSILALVYLIIFGSLVAINAYMWLFKVSNPAWVSTYAFINPVVAVFLGWALGGESLTTTTLMAASIIIVSVFLVTIYRTRSRPVTDPSKEP